MANLPNSLENQLKEMLEKHGTADVFGALSDVLDSYVTKHPEESWLNYARLSWHLDGITAHIRKELR